jgi:hypothetical protein
VGYLNVRQTEGRQVHLQQLPPLFGPGALELLDNRRAALQRWINHGQPVGAKEGYDSAIEAAQVIDALYEGVHCDLVLVVAVILRARGGERIPFVDDQDGAATTSRRLSDPVERLGKKRSHFSHLARAADAIAQLEQNRIFAASFGNKPVREAFGGGGLASADITVKDRQRILLGDKIAERQFAAVVLLVPGAELAKVEKQAQLLVNALVARLKAKENFFLCRKRSVGQDGLAIKESDCRLVLVHAAKSLRCMPNALLV